MISPKLNDISKDEVAFIDPGEDDLSFFNSKWQAAQKI